MAPELSTSTRDGSTDTDQRLILLWHRAGKSPTEFGIWPERPVTIGRDPTNTVSIDSGFVSKVHARIKYSHGRYVLEDLRSANGTRVNGTKVDMCPLEPGDVIEIGDQELTLALRTDEARPRSRRASPVPRAVFIGGGIVVMLVALASAGYWYLVSSAPDRDVTRPTDSGNASHPSKPVPPAASPVSGEEPKAVVEVVERAKVTGVDAAGALYDEAMLQRRGGRLRDALVLLRAVLHRDPADELARARLPELEQEIERAISDHMAAADRAFGRLRYEDAVLEWEQVQLLAEPGDPRFSRAEQRAAEAKRAMGR